MFHIVGLLGFIFFDRELFTRLSVYNLLLMFLLILYTSGQITISFSVFILVCVLGGIAVEIAGTTTGMIFGNYSYSKVLGPGFMNVPFIIGINWFIVIYCCGIFTQTLLLKMMAVSPQALSKTLKAATVIIDGAILAVLFDWIMEPVAVKLGYWTWEGDIPLMNYISWFVISCIMLTVFHFLKFNKNNRFAINLLLIQMMFFLILRLFL